VLRSAEAVIDVCGFSLLNSYFTKYEQIAPMTQLVVNIPTVIRGPVLPPY